MRILALGDVFGRPGRGIIISKAGEIRAKYRADFLIVNCENASGGSGVSAINAGELLAVKAVDVYTSGQSSTAAALKAIQIAGGQVNG